MQPAPAYLDRLQLAVDVRLVDDVGRWPALAEQARQIVERIAATAPTRRRVLDALSTEERLLHAVAQALGGQLDDREARTIHDQVADTDRDAPFVAIVLACRGYDTERARAVYALALADTLSPALAESLRLAFERGFPPARADRLPARVRSTLLERWPATTWSRIVRALAGGDRELAELALHQPQLVAGAGPRAIDALVAHGRWRPLLAQLGDGSADDQRARLGLLARVTAWRTPLPAAPIGIALARSGAGDDATTLALALATGDSAAAAQIRREPLLADPEAAFAVGLAMLGGSAADVRALGRAMPALDRARSPAATASTIHAALFALELGDRAALRELVGPLLALRETVWGRVLLARCYLAIGDTAAIEPLLFRDEGPVAALLRARALAATQAETACAWLRDLFVEHPGWAEARLRYGVALAATDPRRGIAILEDTAASGADDTAVLGPPATARALAQLAVAELGRRAGTPAPELAMRIRVAVALAPTSPAVARQAATIAVAMRAVDVAREALARLQDLAPSSRAGERLAAALLELAGDVAGATAKYRELGAWDRLAVLAARARTTPDDVPLPDLDQLGESPSVAALQGVAVVASARGDLGLAAEALARAIARRPDHAGLASDYVAVKLHQAKTALAEGDLADLFYAARDLERATHVVAEPRLRSAHAALGVALCTRWLRAGERARATAYLEELRGQLDPRRDAAPRALVSLHLVAIALHDGLTDDALAALDELPRDHHARLLRALHARLVEDHDTLARQLPALARAEAPLIRAGARLLATDPDDDDSLAALAAWALHAAPGEGPEALGVDAALHVACLLADSGSPHAPIAAYVDRVASLAPDLDAARRARLVALGLRATMAEPPPLDLAALDLGQLGDGDERDLAVGLVALELQRRRELGDQPGAHQALTQLVMLVRPAGAIGVLALASIEDAADAALADWRAYPSDESTLQAALATGLRRAVARELGGEDDAACRAAWQHVIGALAPVLVSQEPWHTLAEHRGDVYTVPHLELENARAACQRRIADIFVTLGKWHTARGSDAAQANARLDALRHALATELSIARSVQTIIDEHGYLEELPAPLGPIGLDVLGYRARAVAYLGAIDPDTETAGLAADLRGILAGALLDGWIALHDGRLDVAEQVARDRLGSASRPENDAMRLLAAIYVRRIREAYDEADLNGAGDLAAEWVTREQLPELPEELAVEIAKVCRALATRYGLNPARRRLQQIRHRAGHDVRTLRDVEAELILEYVDRGRADLPLDRTRLLGEAMTLSPSDATRERLQEALVDALAATKEADGVDEILALLAAACGGDPQKLAAAFVAAQVRKSELVDRRLRSSAALELRIEELRRVLDLGRNGHAPVARLLDRLVFLHERLHQIYETAGNPHEAQRHARRAAAYRNWHAEGPPS